MAKITVAYVLAPDSGLFAFETVRGLVELHDHHGFEPIVVLLGDRRPHDVDEFIDRAKVVRLAAPSGGSTAAKTARLLKLLGWIGREHPTITSLFPQGDSFYLGAPSALVGYPTVFHLRHAPPAVDSPLLHSPTSATVVYRIDEARDGSESAAPRTKYVGPVFGHLRRGVAQRHGNESFVIATVVAGASDPWIPRIIKGLAGAARRANGRRLAIQLYLTAQAELKLTSSLDEALLDAGLGDVERIVVDREIPARFFDADLLFDAGSTALEGHIALAAASAGIPILALDGSFGASFVVNYRSGRIVAPGSSFRIADAILKLVESPDNLRYYAEGAADDVHRRFDPRRSVRAVERLYLSVAGSP